MSGITGARGRILVGGRAACQFTEWRWDPPMEAWILAGAYDTATADPYLMSLASETPCEIRLVIHRTEAKFKRVSVILPSEGRFVATGSGEPEHIPIGG